MHHKFFLFLVFSWITLLCGEEFCPFCNEAILNNQEVYRGTYWRVLVDYKPVVEGHLLIVPIEHHVTRHELSWDEHNELYAIEKKIHCVFKERFGPEIEDFQYEKNGPALQSVNHFHIHVLPIAPKMKSLLEKIKLVTRLFVFPPKALSNDKRQQEQEFFLNLFGQDI
ncbi:hypothetical protein PHSC3_000210 [Chlamydiales bacterium STE3]|nr:hypothetical protein PHSC3_000210 [Chlamydiales bacterium STE3]